MHKKHHKHTHTEYCKIPTKNRANFYCFSCICVYVRKHGACELMREPKKNTKLFPIIQPKCNVKNFVFFFCFLIFWICWPWANGYHFLIFTTKFSKAKIYRISKNEKNNRNPYKIEFNWTCARDFDTTAAYGWIQFKPVFDLFFFCCWLVEIENEYIIPYIHFSAPRITRCNLQFSLYVYVCTRQYTHTASAQTNWLFNNRI